ncbi:MAG: patatin-like phospholipase family protein [Steroidobacteraceae bacterium]
MRLLTLIVTLSLALTAPLAAAADDAATPPHRPRIGLVLSGGGARGAAHIGVLKVLDELHIPIDAIAGTSMGAVVGGLYASGMSGNDIEKLLTSVDWQDAFRDRPPRAGLAYRRKLEERDYIDVPLGIRGKRLLLPRGLIQGQKLVQILRQQTLPVAGIQDFDKLPIPFRAVATDLANGERVILGSGDLTMALRASLSAPGVFTPVTLDNRLLVDGGLSSNLPVDVARSMGVDILIVVDVGNPLLSRQQLNSIARVSTQTLAVLMRSDTERQLGTLSSHDVLIQPIMSDVASYDFRVLRKAIDAGYAAARAAAPNLAEHSDDDADYQRYLQLRAARNAPLPVPQFIAVAPGSERYARLVQATFGDMAGQPLQPNAIARRENDLYGRGELESIDYQLSQDATQRDGLLFNLQRNSWGPNYVRFGLSLQDDFEGNSSFNAYGRLDFTELNQLGGEWVWDGRIGTSPSLSSEFYQPLSLAQRYFIAPHAEVEAHNVSEIVDGEVVGRYRVRSFQMGLDLGRELGSWGEVRTGVLDTNGSSRLTLGSTNIPATTFHARAYFARLSYDRMDSATFPHSGQALQLEGRTEEGDAGGEQGTDQLSLDWRIAGSLGKNTFIGWVSAGSTVGGSATNVRTYFELGGFANLSGITADSLAGPHYGIARAIYMRKVGSGGEGLLNVPAYAGLSLEMGNVWSDRKDIGLEDIHKDAALFFGADTYLGPAYLAVGYDQKGQGAALYLFLGRGL